MSHSHLQRTQIKKESDILSTSVVVEDIARRMYVRDTLEGEKMQEEITI